MVTPFILMLSSCKTKEGATTKLGKFYHNVTGRYNGYYNADVLLVKSFESQTLSNRDNYNKLLAMYPYIAAEKPAVVNKGSGDNSSSNPKLPNPKSSAIPGAGDNNAAGSSSSGSPLDEAIKKCAINIELHKPSDWVDDSYFIIGRAEFLKQEYDKSASTFQYIINKFKDEKAISEMTPDELKEYRKEQAEKEAEKRKKQAELKKKEMKKKVASFKKKKKKKKKPVKKPAGSTSSENKDISKVNSNNNQAIITEEEELKPKKYFLKHRPIRFDAMLWAAKSYIEIDNYDEAGRLLRALTEQGDVPRKIKAEAFAVTSYSFIKQKEYEKAIEPLETAVSLIKRKKKKTRYVYVLAQLYQKMENNQKAMENFKRVLRLAPVYEMEFNARLNIAINASGLNNSTINPEMALKKMLRDGKNEEYKDQIYFALAQIQLKSGNKDNGIAALQMAMANSDGFQKTEASYLLAELFFERENFIKAYHYYDTCSANMLKTDERTFYVSSQVSLLKDLAMNLEAVTLKDSLLAIAQLPFEKQKEYVQKLRQEEEDNKKNNGSKSNVQKPSGDGAINTTALNASKFPLYDPTVVKKGEKDFQKRWGNRPWQDNWRRASSDNRNNSKDDSNNEGLKPLTESEVKDYLKKLGIPQDSLAIKIMNKDIEKSLFMIGNLYFEKLAQNMRAKDAFNKLFARYPNTQYELEAWFAVYNICTDDKSTACSNAYKEKIIEKYPNSDIAKSLMDPNFMNTKQKQIFEVNKYYEETYALIKSGEFQTANKRMEDLPKKFGNTYPLKPRFALLAAMCVGGIEGIDSYIKALKSVSVSYPNTEEDKKAKEMVALLSSSKSNDKSSSPQVVKNENEANKPKYPFDMEINTGHYVLVVFEDTKVNVNDFKNKITDFNTKNFNLMRLNVSTLMLDGSLPTLIVRKFKDRKDAEDYLQVAVDNNDFLPANTAAFKLYFIGQNNYREVLQKQNFAEYVKFYEDTFK